MEPFLSAFAEDHGRNPWMNAYDGPFEARRAKEGTSADSAEEMRETTGVSPWRLHFAYLLARLIKLLDGSRDGSITFREASVPVTGSFSLSINPI